MESTVECIGLGQVRANCFDLDNLKQLISLRLRKTNSNWDFTEMPAITWLSLWGGYFASNPSQLWYKFPNSREVEIVHSKIDVLPSLAHMESLKFLRFHYCAKLSDIDVLGNNWRTLTHLTIQNCPSLYDLDRLGTLENLTHLEMHRCGAIKDFNFAKNLNKLRWLIIQSNTFAEDGDLAWLASKADGKFNISLQNKRHYNYVF